MERFLLLSLLLHVAYLYAVRAQCADKDTRCKSWAEAGECTSNPNYMIPNCKKSCNKCADECKNKGSKSACEKWTNAGYCRKSSQWYGYMKENCKKSCFFCRAADKSSATSQKDCVDIVSEKDCNLWTKRGYCEMSHRFHGYMDKNCKKTCGFCIQALPTENKDCKDKDTAKDCKLWKSKGYCEDSSQFHGYMKKHCKDTCSFCSQAGDDCKDLHDSKKCVEWASTGECKKNPAWMKMNCKKSCKECTKSSSKCRDIFDTVLCKKWATDGDCVTNSDWMIEFCTKSCNNCSGTSTGSASGSGTGGDKATASIASASSTINEQVCGLRLKSRVVGGKAAAQGDWPWQVGLARSYSPTNVFCGGTLINRQWVVTANHCFGGDGSSTARPQDFLVRLAEHDISSKQGNEVVKKVSKIVRHKDYQLPSYDADITLVKLETPVEYNFLIKPICLPDANQDEKVGESCYVTGWGRLQEGGAQAKVLQEAKIPIVSKTTCRQSYGFSTITDNMICAGLEEGGVDACQGDSGGPFVCLKGGRFQLSGVVSFGRGCARQKLYGVYAKVSKYMAWIKKTIKE